MSALGDATRILGVGRTVLELAHRAPEGRVCGVDFAGAGVAVARRTNAGALRMIGGRARTAAAHREALVAAGYAAVEVFEERSKGWICVVGTRAAAS